MHLLELSGILLAAYLAAGRTGAVVSCLLFGLTPWMTLVIALALDAAQIPVYGILLEMTDRYISLPDRIHKWVEKRSRRMQEWFKKRDFLTRVKRFRPVAVVFISLVPFRGFGIFSACILAYVFGFRKFPATLLIMAGSLIGALLSILLFYFPVRWINAL